MSVASSSKKLARSVLFRAPGLYTALSGEHRFVLAHRLGLVHEPDFRALPSLVRTVRPLVVDVGANVGQSALSTLRVLPGAHVVGFEPNPSNWASLDRVARRFPSFRYERVGLGSATGDVTLYVPSYAGKSMSGLASLDEHEARSWLSPRTVHGFDSRKLAVTATTVPVRQLDDYGLAPDVVKIDVQGLEEHVVRGALTTLRRHLPVLLVESPSAELVDLLATTCGYTAFEWESGRLRASERRNMNQIFVSSGEPAGSRQVTGGSTGPSPDSGSGG